MCALKQIDDAQRLAYRWLFMITRSFVDFNGTVPEKYDVVARTHRVAVEYGNVGTVFAYVTREGFGWMNASYQVHTAVMCLLGPICSPPLTIDGDDHCRYGALAAGSESSDAGPAARSRSARASGSAV